MGKISQGEFLGRLRDRNSHYAASEFEVVGEYAGIGTPLHVAALCAATYGTATPTRCCAGTRDAPNAPGSCGQVIGEIEDVDA